MGTEGEPLDGRGEKGAAALDGDWKAVEGAPAAERAAMRFFKVVVELP